MALDFTVDTAVARVKRTCQFPATNAKLTDAELVQIMDEEIQSRLWPALMQVRDDYAITWLDLTLAQDENLIRLPPQISSSTLVELRYVEASTGVDRTIPRMEEPMVGLGSIQGDRGPTPRQYVVVGDNVLIQPTPTQDISLRFVYERRPSRLVLISECGIVTGTGNSDSGMRLILANPDAFSEGNSVDLVPGRPPLGVVSQLATITLIDVNSYYLQINDIANPSPWTEMSYGGYVCSPGETCVFPLPDAWFSAWIMSSAATAATQYGASSAPLFREQAQDEIDRLIAFQSNRVRKQAHLIFDRGSNLRRGWYQRGGPIWNGP